MRPHLLKRYIFWMAVLIIGLNGCAEDARNPENWFKPIAFIYPQTFQDSLFADTLHGVAVEDPFRWMEAEEAPILQDWLAEQRALSRDYLSQIVFRKGVAQRVHDLWNYERTSSYRQQGAFLYYLHNNGLQEQDVLMRKSLQNSSEEVVLDPNTWSASGSVAIGQIAFSTDSRYLAYERSEYGSDWRTIHLWDLQEMKPLTDTLQWVKYSQIAWAGDGFFYSRYPAPLRGEQTSTPMEFHQVFYHRLGTSQSEDQIVFADRARSRRGFTTQTSSDERFLVLTIWETHSGNGVYVLDRQNESRGFTPIVDDMANAFAFVGSQGENLLFLTDFEADRGRLIQINIQKPDPGFWEVIIPEKHDVLHAVYQTGGKLTAHYIRDAQQFLQLYEADGRESMILTMQEAGAISDFQGRQGADKAYFTFESFLTPPTVYELDAAQGTARIHQAAKVNFQASAYETRLIFFKSGECIDIPMFLTLKKGLKLDGRRPVVLLAEGDFGAVRSPRFDPSMLSLLENEGVLAQAVVRGGREYGREWYESGIRSKKENAINDFQAATDYLISEGYTQREKLAIFGQGAEGGLLVAASIAQRPDLYRVAIAGSGIYDLVRYQQFTIGSKWAYDLGRSEQPREFDYLQAISPLHNTMPAAYPATLSLCGLHDDRVYPAHACKWAATLQANQRGPLPVLFLPEREAGQDWAKPVSMQIRERADLLSFVYFHLQQPVVYDYKK